MDPDDRLRKENEPYFAWLWRKAYAIAPLLLVLGVLLAWILATDTLSLGSREPTSNVALRPEDTALPGVAATSTAGEQALPTAGSIATPTAQDAGLPPALPTSPVPSSVEQPTVVGQPPSPTTTPAEASVPVQGATTTATATHTSGPTVVISPSIAASFSPTVAGPSATAGPSVAASPSPESTATPATTPADTPTASPTSAATSAPPPQTGWTAYGGEWDWKESGLAEGTTEEGDALWLFDSAYGDFSYSAEGQTFDREASLAFRMEDENNGFLFILIPQGATAGEPGLYLKKRVEGSDDIVASAAPGNMPWLEDWATLSVEATGDSLRLYLNGDLVIEYEDTEAPSFRYGRLGFHIYGDADAPCSARFRNVHLPSATPA